MRAIISILVGALLGATLAFAMLNLGYQPERSCEPVTPSPTPYPTASYVRGIPQWNR